MKWGYYSIDEGWNEGKILEIFAFKFMYHIDMDLMGWFLMTVYILVFFGFMMNRVEDL